MYIITEATTVFHSTSYYVFVTHVHHHLSSRSYLLSRVDHISLSFSLLLESNATWAIPLPLRMLFHADAPKVIPFDLAIIIVACDHLSVADLVAEAICWFVRIHRQF